ncbi:FtsW/RodA/SpoVE family cell cycle protein [Gorillibacterium timonense]|uniref:FtsW/RodA/SpoVE family cell cycle protein n=1 Tax=Gorillibacterium timonense TaxID=1689269 RepID=UPI00071C567D|nr:FtsW/RodA/SpoVE family cell cycle protein [Gorillibacterium timonense]
MRRLEKEPRIQLYLDQVCKQVRAKAMHPELRLELLGHLEETVEELDKEGLREDSAIQAALQQMGDPRTVGEEFDQAHRPRFDVGFFAAIVILALLGIALAFSVNSATEGRLGSHNGFYRTAAAVIGLALFFVMRLFPYRLLSRFPMGFYGVALLLIYVSFDASGPSGEIYLSIGSYALNGSELVSVLFLLALAGAVSSKLPWMDSVSDFTKMRRIGSAFGKLLYLTKLGFIFWVIPGLAFLKFNDLSSYFLYAISAGFLLFLAIHRTGMMRRGPAQRIGLLRLSKVTVGLSVLAACFILIPFVLSDSVRILRMTMHRLFNGMDGYQITQVSIALEKAGWWGHGFGAPFKSLPAFYSEMAFPYFVYSMGWAAGLALIALLLYFTVSLIRLAWAIRDPFGRCLGGGLAALLLTKTLWNLAMCFRLVPIMGVSIPFFSYAPTSVLLNFVMCGVLGSIFRNRNRMPSPAPVPSSK